MNISKNIALGVTLVVIIGAIWYLESIQVHPGALNGAVPQTIGLSSDVASSTDVVATGTLAAAPTGTSVGSPSASVKAAPSSALAAIAAADKKAGYHPAIELADAAGFINAPNSFTLKGLIGKQVILLDFWTYSCINCIRTLPYLTAWYGKYKDQGFTIVGVHTPEFEFEKNYNNVQAATKKYGIDYPVVLDSNYGTWTAYNNLYWPHEYLIDIAGYIVHDQVGEGSYGETERRIQALLAQRDMALGVSNANIPTGYVNVQESDLSHILSPETYFGSDRNSLLSNGYAMVDGRQVLAEPQSTPLNKLYLTGSWTFKGEYATNNQAGAKVIYHYNSANVYFVASASPAVTVQVLQDGKPVTSEAGSDVVNGKVTISGSRLYNLIKNSGGAGEHTLELIIESPGLQAFTFTFG